MTPIRVLFVCHGNICRSTLAESVFTHMLYKRGLESQFSIDSFATSREEIGNPPHRGTINQLKKCGIPLVPHRAKQITLVDYEEADYILAMDDWNMRNLHRMFSGDKDGKIRKLLDFAENPDKGRDIADPWYTGNFDETYRDVLLGCEGFLDFLKSENIVK